MVATIAVPASLALSPDLKLLQDRMGALTTFRADYVLKCGEAQATGIIAYESPSRASLWLGKSFWAVSKDDKWVSWRSVAQVQEEQKKGSVNGIIQSLDGALWRSKFTEELADYEQRLDDLLSRLKLTRRAPHRLSEEFKKLRLFPQFVIGGAVPGGNPDLEITLETRFGAEGSPFDFLWSKAAGSGMTTKREGGNIEVTDGTLTVVFRESDGMPLNARLKGKDKEATFELFNVEMGVPLGEDTFSTPSLPPGSAPQAAAYLERIAGELKSGYLGEIVYDFAPRLDLKEGEDWVDMTNLIVDVEAWRYQDRVESAVFRESMKAVLRAHPNAALQFQTESKDSKVLAKFSDELMDDLYKARSDEVAALAKVLDEAGLSNARKADAKYNIYKALEGGQKQGLISPAMDLLRKLAITGEWRR